MRPEFIPREKFRQFMTSGQINKILSVDGIQATSFINRRNRDGRPIRQSCGMHRPLDVVAAARADALKVEVPLEKRVIRRREELEGELARLERELSARIGCAQRQLALADVSSKLTNRLLHSEKELVDCADQMRRVCGVYFLVSNGRVVYVGQSINVYARVANHTIEREFDSFSYVTCDEAELDVLESLYIHLLRPDQNGRWRSKVRGETLVAPFSLNQLLQIGARQPGNRSKLSIKGSEA